MKIPKIIHQSAASNELAPEILLNIEAMKELNPKWEHRFYDDQQVESYIKKHYDKGIFKAFNSINPLYGAAKADLFRYLLIYKEGGLWLDIKSSASEPLHQVISPRDTIIFSQWENRIGEAYPGWGYPAPSLRKIPGGEIQQWFILSEPHNPYIKAVIQQVLANINNYNADKFGTGFLGVLQTTGPIAYTFTIVQLLKKFPCRFTSSHDSLKLQYSIYTDEKIAFREKMIKHRKLSEQHYTQLDEPVILT